MLAWNCQPPCVVDVFPQDTKRSAVTLSTPSLLQQKTPERRLKFRNCIAYRKVLKLAAIKQLLHVLVHLLDHSGYVRDIRFLDTLGEQGRNI